MYEPVGDDPQRAEREQRERGRDHRSAVVPGARRHADRGNQPQRRGRREPADGESLADDRARAEEADAADDLRGDSRGIGTDDRAAVHEKLAEAVGRHDREERRADADDEMGPQARLALAQLPLEPDRAAEGARDDEAQQHMRPGQRRNHGELKEVQRTPPPPGSRRSARFPTRRA